MAQDGPPACIDSLTTDAQGKPIRCQDGPIGHVADVLVDPVTGSPLYLVWREAVVVTREVSIPVSYIDRIDDSGIVLRVERDVIDRLPHFWTADAGARHVPTHEGY